MSPTQCVEAEPTSATTHKSNSEQKANLLKSSCGTPPLCRPDLEPGGTGRVRTPSVDAQCAGDRRRLPDSPQGLPPRWKTAPTSRRNSTVGGRMEGTAKDASGEMISASLPAPKSPETPLRICPTARRPAPDRSPAPGYRSGLLRTGPVGRAAPRRQRRLVYQSSNRQESHRNSCRESPAEFLLLDFEYVRFGKPKTGRPHFGFLLPKLISMRRLRSRTPLPPGCPTIANRSPRTAPQRTG